MQHDVTSTVKVSRSRCQGSFPQFLHISAAAQAFRAKSSWEGLRRLGLWTISSDFIRFPFFVAVIKHFVALRSTPFISFVTSVIRHSANGRNFVHSVHIDTILFKEASSTLSQNVFPHRSDWFTEIFLSCARTMNDSQANYQAGPYSWNILEHPGTPTTFADVLGIGMHG